MVSQFLRLFQGFWPFLPVSTISFLPVSTISHTFIYKFYAAKQTVAIIYDQVLQNLEKRK